MSAGHHHRHDLSQAELDDLLDEALASPKIKARLARPFKLITKYDVPLVGSSSVGGHHVYLDKDLRHGDWPYGVLPLQGRRIDTKQPLIRHERLEQALEDEFGWPYMPLAHPVAQHWEERWVRLRGFNPREYERLYAPFIKTDASKPLHNVPTDLDLRPLLAPPADRKLMERVKQAQQTEKVSQDSVEYVEKSRENSKKCANCLMYVDSRFGGPDCTLVKSPIAPNGVCRRFAAGKLGV